MQSENLRSERELQQHHFRDNHGVGLLAIYNFSPHAVVASLYERKENMEVEVVDGEKKEVEVKKEEKEKEKEKGEEIERIPIGKKGYWNSMENQRAFANALARKLGFEVPSPPLSLSPLVFFLILLLLLLLLHLLIHLPFSLSR